MNIHTFCAKHDTFPLQRTYVMGIVNVTPDSFSDGGLYWDPDQAVHHALTLQQQGADIIDIGGQSTRPGHIPLRDQEELERIRPVLERLNGRLKIPLSVDTYYPLVAQYALSCGAAIINDVSGKIHPDMAKIVLESNAGWVIMDAGGDDADGIVPSCERRLQRMVEQALALGIQPDHLCIDPGFGFGKDQQQNEQLLLGLDQLNPHGYPLLVGASRKRFVGGLSGVEIPNERDAASLAVHQIAVQKGAHFIRTHNVAMTVQMCRTVDRLIQRENA